MKTKAHIAQEYIDATADKWDAYMEKLKNLWGKMKGDINISGHGADKYSSKAEPFWKKFKADTAAEYAAYQLALRDAE